MIRCLCRLSCCCKCIGMCCVCWCWGGVYVLCFGSYFGCDVCYGE